jgi:hypothetical protein
MKKRSYKFYWILSNGFTVQSKAKWNSNLIVEVDSIEMLIPIQYNEDGRSYVNFIGIKLYLDEALKGEYKMNEFKLNGELVKQYNEGEKFVVEYVGRGQDNATKRFDTEAEANAEFKTYKEWIESK